MIYSLFLSAAASIMAEPLPFPDDLLRGIAYLPRYDQQPIIPRGNSHFYSIQYFGAPDYSAVTIQAYWTKNPGQLKYLQEPLGTQKGEEQRLARFSVLNKGKRTFSGMAPNFAGTSIDKTAVFIQIDTTWASVVCQWSPRLVDNGTQYWEPAPYDARTKSAFAEKIARHTLIRAAGLRLDPVSNDDSTTSAQCRLTQAKFSDLTKWAELNGWKIGDENEYGIITLKKGDVEAVLPLGADQIKVNGVWKEMGDSAAFFNGKLYLPAAGLGHLQGAS